MSWNHPIDGKNANCAKHTSRTRGARGFLTVGIAVIITAFVFWLIFSIDSDKPEAKDSGLSKERKIASVQPAAAPKTKPKKDVLIGSRGLEIPTYGLKTYRDENGILRYEGGSRVYDPNQPSEVLSLRNRSLDPFDFSSENSIASLIGMTGGDLIAGEIEYGEEFVEDFKNSLTNKIVISDTDSDYMRDQKEALIAVKKDLKERLDRGEDIAALMNDARTDLQNMNKYRQELMDQVHSIANSEETPDSDIEDLINAANLMLRENGIKEIDDNEVVRWNLILEERKERAAMARHPADNGGTNEQ